MTVVKSQSFCGGQNGLTILAKIIFKSLGNILDHLVRPFWPIFFWESFELFVATMVNGSEQPISIDLVGCKNHWESRMIKQITPMLIRPISCDHFLIRK